MHFLTYLLTFGDTLEVSDYFSGVMAPLRLRPDCDLHAADEGDQT